MVQTSDKQSGETNVSIRKGMRFFESELPQEKQEYTGWYYCSERKAYYRWDKFIGEKNEAN